MARAFTPRTSRGVPTPVLPAVEEIVYRPCDWEAEAFAAFAEGRDPAQCPRCARTGFYGPRFAEDVGQHRACRFCGFFQRVDGPVEQATPLAHDCNAWPIIARARYLWWSEPGAEAWTCPFCGEAVRVDDSRAEPPVDDPQHPWWRVPQARNRFYYARLWENWAFTKGRAFL